MARSSRGLGWFIARRVMHAAIVVILVSTLVFVLLRLAPGDPFTSAMEHPGVTDAVRQTWAQSYGLHEPVGEQYLLYLRNIVRGDLGWSFSQHRPVSHVLRDALPYTMLLASIALVAGFAAGIALGVWQARRAGRRADRIADAGTMVLSGLPDFWLAILVLLTFSVWLPWFPGSGAMDPVMYEYFTPWQRFTDRVAHLILPAGTLALLIMAMVARYQRAELLRILPEPFVDAARARGLSERRVIYRHALRNALAPVATLFGLSIPLVFTGAVFIEKIFAWPGLGWVILNGVSTRDYPLVTAGVILTSAAVTLGSIIADLLYAWCNPRVARA